MVRYGNLMDGGWEVCVTPPYKISSHSIVYSFGLAWLYTLVSFCTYIMYQFLVSNLTLKQIFLARICIKKWKHVFHIVIDVFY